MAETRYTPFADQKDATPVRLIVRRVRPTPGSQLAAFVLYDYHAFITDRDDIQSVSNPRRSARFPASRRLGQSVYWFQQRAPRRMVDIE